MPSNRGGRLRARQHTAPGTGVVVVDLFAQKDPDGLFAVKRDPDAQPRKRKAASAAEQPPRSSMIARKAAHKKNKVVEVAAATRATFQALGSASATRARVTLYRATETTRCVAC